MFIDPTETLPEHEYESMKNGTCAMVDFLKILKNVYIFYYNDAILL